MQRKVVANGKEFTVELTPDLEEGGYVVTCSEIPATISQGETEQEALENIQDAIELCLKVGKELEGPQIP